MSDECVSETALLSFIVQSDALPLAALVAGLPEADWLAVSEEVTPTGDLIRTLSKWGVDGQSTQDDLEAQTASLLERASEAVGCARAAGMEGLSTRLTISRQIPRSRLGTTWLDIEEGWCRLLGQTDGRVELSDYLTGEPSQFKRDRPPPPDADLAVVLRELIDTEASGPVKRSVLKKRLESGGLDERAFSDALRELSDRGWVILVRTIIEDETLIRVAWRPSEAGRLNLSGIQ
jgi:hypothetical protein